MESIFSLIIIPKLASYNELGVKYRISININYQMTWQIFINMVKVQKEQKISEGLHESRLMFMGIEGFMIVLGFQMGHEVHLCSRAT